MLRGNNILIRSTDRKDINILYNIIEDDAVRAFDGNTVVLPSKECILENFNAIFSSEKKYLTIINEKNVVVGYETFQQAKNNSNIYEIGITIGKAFWHRGYGSEAIRTLIRFLFLEKAAERVELNVAAINEKAINCYKKCGFIEEGILRKKFFSQGRYSSLVVMSIIKEEYIDKYKISQN